jgi:FMN phosphatase YigB (HAD superfamily)
MQLKNESGQRQIEAVIFDLDDTLIDWSKQEIGWPEFMLPGVRTMCSQLAEMGYTTPEPEQVFAEFSRVLEASWDDARETWNGVSFYRTLHETCRCLGIELTDSEVIAAANCFSWGAVPGVVTFDDTLDVLTTLQTQGYKLGLITNSFQPMWMRDVELEQFGLIDFFPRRITSGDTGFIKPHPAIYWRMLGLLDTIPERSVFVGDHPAFDIQGANLTGMISVLMSPPHLDRDLNGHEPDFTIETLSELLPILEQIDVV